MAAFEQWSDSCHSQFSSRVDLYDQEGGRGLCLPLSGGERQSSCKGWVFRGRWWYWARWWVWVILATNGADPSVLVHLGVFASLCILSWESICGFLFCTGHILDMWLIYLYIFLMHVDALFMDLYASLFMMMWNEMPMWCIFTRVYVLYIIMHDVGFVCFLCAMMNVPI